MEITDFILFGLIGFIIGFIGGMVGLVLGVVRFPFIFGIESSVSVVAGTNIGISTFGAIAATIKHYRENRFHFRIFLVMALTGAVGSFLGSFFTKMIPSIGFLILILLIVGYEAIILIRNSKRTLQYTNFDSQYKKESVIGFGIGFLGGFVGLVLGSIRLPAMIQILKMEPKIAVGTNLAASSIMGTSGLIGHMINGEINFSILLVMGTGAIVGGILGARLTGKFSSVMLKKIIGITLIGVTIFLLFRIFQQIY